MQGSALQEKSGKSGKIKSKVFLAFQLLRFDGFRSWVRDVRFALGFKLVLQFKQSRVKGYGEGQHLGGLGPIYSRFGIRFERLWF